MHWWKSILIDDHWYMDVQQYFIFNLNIFYQNVFVFSVRPEVRNSGLCPDPDQSAKMVQNRSGIEHFGPFWLFF